VTDKKTGGEAPASAGDLRRRAEQQYDARLAPATPTGAEAAAHLHELGVHQIELEMQNEELRRHQQELEAARARYVELYDLAPVGYMTLAADGRILEANLPAAALLGVNRERLLGHRLRGFVHEADRDAYYLHERRLARVAMREACDVRLSRPPEETVWVRLESTTFPAGDGELHRRTVISDITASKASDRALRESEEQYRSLFEVSASVTLLVDPDGGAIVDANRAACDWYGWSRDELLAMTIADINTLASVSVQAEMASALAREKRFFRFQHRLADGTTRDVDVVSGPYKARGRTLLHSVVTDVTESVRATTELADHGEQLGRLVAERTAELNEVNRVMAQRADEVARWRRNFHAFFDTIDDLLFVLDAGGGIIHVNGTVCRRLGYTPEELLGRPVLDVHPASRREEAGRIVAAMLAGSADACPVPLVTKDGVEIPVETRVVPGIWDGKPALFGVSKDVSALRRSEEKFARAFDSAPALMAVSTAAEGRFIDVNEMFLATLGLRREEVVGRTPEELGLPAGLWPRRDAAGAAGQSSVRDQEFSLCSKDGTIIQGLFSVDPIVLGDEPCLLTTMLDLTARRQAEEALAESEALYRSIVSAFPENVTITDLEGRVRLTSPRAVKMFGFQSVDQAVGRPLTDFLAPESRASAMETIARMRERVGTAVSDYRGLRTDGSTFPMEVSGAFIRGPQDEPTGMVFIVRDVTANKQAAARVRESEEQLARAVEGSGAGLWDWNVRDREVTFNEQWAETAGYTLAELGPISVDDWNDMWHPDDLRRSDALIERHFAGEFPMYECEVRVRHKDGHWIWVLDRGKVSERDEEGRPLRMVGVQLDITARKEAEEALRLRESYLSAIIENQPGLVWLKDTEGRFLAANTALAGLAGVPAAGEVIGKTDLDIFPRERAERFRSDDAAIMAGGAPIVYEQMLELRGDSRWFETFKAAVRDAEGVLLGVTGFATDVTDRRLADERLREANRRLEDAVARANDLAVEAQTATVAKSVFLAHMSHEIRTPLNAIIGFAQVLQHDADVTERQRDRLTIINRSGEHLLALLNDILELSKVESGVQRLDPVPFDLPALLEDLALVFCARAQAKTLTFATEGFGELPRHVVADQLKLRQVLTNLLSNAVKFTDSGGILFRARAVAQDAGASRLVVQIEDTGAGIALEETAALFAPFEQAAAGRRSGTGTGLGLAISRQFAEAMGGTLDVTSEVGAGSVFRFEVPVATGTEAAAAAAAATCARRVLRIEPDQAPCTVLVVDDADGRRLLQDVLTDVGFQVVEAADGFAAAAALAKWRPQVVVTGADPRNLAGADIVRHIRLSPQGADTRIIALTAEATAEVRESVLAAGADAFMTKPFRQAELLEQIRLFTGVRYVLAEAAERETATAESPPALTRAQMDALPDELRHAIRDAAIRARHGRLLGLTEQVAAIDAETAARLHAVVTSFDYAALLRALEGGAS